MVPIVSRMSPLSCILQLRRQASNKICVVYIGPNHSHLLNDVASHILCYSMVGLPYFHCTKENKFFEGLHVRRCPIFSQTQVRAKKRLSRLLAVVSAKASQNFCVGMLCHVFAVPKCQTGGRFGIL